jgi:RNA polymerase sigma-70 factor (ECF subfamily)
MSTTAGDEQLVAEMASGDRSAVRRLMARHHVRVFRFVARKLRNESVAEEIANEVFLEAWRSANRFEGHSSVSTWLLSIAHNKAVSTLRRRREESWSDEAADTLADDSDNPEVAAQKVDKGAVLRRCIDRLSADHREIIDLVYYHEQSVVEVAQVLSIPEATVKTRMFYARKKLSELLREAGIDRGWP